MICVVDVTLDVVSYSKPKKSLPERLPRRLSERLSRAGPPGHGGWRLAANRAFISRRFLSIRRDARPPSCTGALPACFYVKNINKYIYIYIYMYIYTYTYSCKYFSTFCSISLSLSLSYSLSLLSLSLYIYIYIWKLYYHSVNWIFWTNSLYSICWHI